MKIQRMFTQKDVDPFSYCKWTKETFYIYSDFGSNKIELKNVEVPAHFSKNAQRILITKYIRLTEVPRITEPVPEKTLDNERPIPEWLQRRRPIYDAYIAIKKYKKLQKEVTEKTGGETEDLSIIHSELEEINEKMTGYFGREESVKQIFNRIAGFYTYWGWSYNYFDDEEDARAFYDEIIYALCHQMFAPNTPTWFNAGLYWAYGIKGDKRGFYRVNQETKEVYETKNTYKYPGAFACFVFEVKDKLLGEGSIYDTLQQMVKAYTYGGGAGINWSTVRSKHEKFSNGNNASGSHPFMVTADRSASNILSGASQRRAANIFIKDDDDPEIEEFVEWKAKEELKVEALGNAGYSMAFGGEAYQTVSGQSVNTTIRVSNQFWDAYNKNKEIELRARTTGAIVKKIKARDLWNKIINSAYKCGDPGIQFDDIIQDWNTLSSTGKNRASNPCVSGDSLLITRSGLQKIENLPDFTELMNPDGSFKKYKVFKTGIKQLYKVTLKSEHSVEITDNHPIYDGKSKKYFTLKEWFELNETEQNKIEPLIFKSFFNKNYSDLSVESSSINTVELTKEDYVYDFQLQEDGEPAAWVNGFQLHNCSEFLPNGSAACNLASVNTNKFVDNGSIKLDEYFHIIRLATIALDIVNSVCQTPSKQVAEGVFNHRYIGLGLTGISKTVMNAGMVYGEKKSMDFVATLYSLMTAQAYLTSAEIAKKLGAFPKYNKNKVSMWNVLKNHYKASTNNKDNENYVNWVGGPLSVNPYEISVGINKNVRDILHHKWKDVLRVSKKTGFRNASVTLLQPSGTLTIILDAGTSAGEPPFSLISNKKMSDGTSMLIIADYVIEAFHNLGYTQNEINDIMKFFLGYRTIEDSPFFNTKLLREYNFNDEDIDNIMLNLKSCERLVDAIKVLELSENTKSKLGIYNKPNVNIFKRLGLSIDQYIEADKYICGASTFEGAPHVKSEHLPIFDTAVVSGYGTRFIKGEHHVSISSAIQPHISHAISKTINLPHWSTEEEISKLYKLAHEKGCKSITIYRDGSKKSQPMINGIDLDWWNQDDNIKIYKRGERRKPPKRRELIAHNVKIKTIQGDKEVIIKFGEYEDRSLAEIYVESEEDNQELHHAMNWLARSISKLIQYGAPIDDIYDSFINKPSAILKGRTNHDYIVSCTSIIDLVVRIMKLEYEGDTTYCKHKPPLSDIRIGKYADKTALSMYHNTKKDVSPTTVFKKDVMTNIDKNNGFCYVCNAKLPSIQGCYTCLCGAEYGTCSIS